MNPWPRRWCPNFPIKDAKGKHDRRISAVEQRKLLWSLWAISFTVKRFVSVDVKIDESIVEYFRRKKIWSFLPETAEHLKSPWEQLSPKGYSPRWSHWARNSKWFWSKPWRSVPKMLALDGWMSWEMIQAVHRALRKHLQNYFRYYRIWNCFLRVAEPLIRDLVCVFKMKYDYLSIAVKTPDHHLLSVEKWFFKILSFRKIQLELWCLILTSHFCNRKGC